ncbi:MULTISPECIES: FixH family protein [Bacillus]|uniref:FixH family protein n=1 Tax=Bacillus TaxID=1386 RepID=UPI000616E92F|nr:MULTISPECIES: FixH family protein [Bacillus]KKB73226.1 hypothetical protein TH62_13410 [Bacillus sp. TH008]MBU8788887.1 FixH family protein [Bacillus glycinifermentans]MDU0073627.1 FixH family protein [Bacillus sp. IG6]MED8021499.1 FixH family protein [Bacillus glycinifermentans]NUJ17754.1 FixH family protein [Bacillus glycinifermentans]
MRLGKWVILFVLTAGLSACGQADKPASTEQEPKLLTAKLTAPEHADKNEKAVIKASVLYGDEPVADADEVEFEVWKSGGKEKSELEKAKNEGKGVYSISKAFPEDGLYKVQVHVTAKKQHTMPVTEVKVGSAKDQAGNDEEEESGHHH